VAHSLKQGVRRQLAGWIKDLKAYRASVDVILNRDHRTASFWRSDLRAVHYWTARLYFDYVALARTLPSMESQPRRRRRRRIRLLSVARQTAMMRRMGEILNASSDWGSDEPNPMLEPLGICTRNDCAVQLSMHLPEMYEEAILTQASMEEFLANQDPGALVSCAIGMMHLASHHAVMIMPVLEWVADLLNEFA